jgi:hypothetical protein
VPPPASMNSNIPPMPLAHILAKCDMIFQDLMIQQRNLYKIYANGWPRLNRLAGHTPKPDRLHSFIAPPPGHGYPLSFAVAAAPLLSTLPLMRFQLCRLRPSLSPEFAVAAVPLLPMLTLTHFQCCRSCHRQQCSLPTLPNAATDCLCTITVPIGVLPLPMLPLCRSP